jgi:hypothetical protein
MNEFSAAEFTAVSMDELEQIDGGKKWWEYVVDAAVAIAVGIVIKKA